MGAKDTASIACLSKETGGRLLRANDPDTLQHALELAFEPETTAPETLSPATLKAPEEWVAGGRFELEWTGPENPTDYITIVEAGAEEGVYSNYVYAKQGSPTTLLALIDPGDAEIRYIAGQSKKILGRRPIKLLPATATLDAPRDAPVGSDVEVHWTGPRGERDYITIVMKGAPEGTWDNYRYTESGSPARVRLTMTPGDREIRYVTGQGNRTLARRPLRTTAITATLRGPTKAIAGSEVEVTWSGPDNPKDFITIVPKGTPAGKWEGYAYTAAGSPSKVRTSLEPGDYEIRYVTGQGYLTLATTALKVEPVRASLEAARSVTAGSKVFIEWTGPNYAQDFITIVKASAEEGTWKTYAYTRKGSPVTVVAPDKAGRWEIRYVTGKARKTLARRPLSVSPKER